MFCNIKSIVFVGIFYRIGSSINIIVVTVNKTHGWPFQEAQALLKNVKNIAPKKGYVLFVTGYGPSGLPHIGTFAEVVRTSMVQKALSKITHITTKLLCVSDDMDGLRKIPNNIPYQDKFREYLGMPLTSVPDPYQKHISYGFYMNSQLQRFLDQYGFHYELISATDLYQNGRFNCYLKKVLRNYKNILKQILPTLSLDRSLTYGLFLPICLVTGKISQVKLIGYNIKNYTITYINLRKQVITTRILDGRCKLQWKVDFPMRWAALDVNYEIYGKDIQANVHLYDKICRILEKTPPQQMSYEFFLDHNGQKISKSKGNGFTVNEWLKYATLDGLKLLCTKRRRKQKRFLFE